ncbi:MAG TPA: tRNA pseudouridine(38-40) synthase TruA [Chitinophagaceae bacterium]|nr:tRNA pseudouridine(38-40) synthase TruA [Chitinophagaceae bacterium]
MPRYFLEVAYKGTRYSGFQVQQNAVTIQSEIEKAFNILHRRPLLLTGSSRTDAGVHALQNYFHFDDEEGLNGQFLYKMNAILPDDIVIKALHIMQAGAHCRFDAVSREYEYRIYRSKNPFLKGIAMYYPYKLNREAMQVAANEVLKQTHFFAFSKSNTQVTNFNCRIIKSSWIETEEVSIYTIEANRFLRGMVRMLTASILQVGRGRLSVDEFSDYFKAPFQKSTYLVPPDGLFLKNVNYPLNFFNK